MEFRFEAEVIYWRGPAPFLFAFIPPDIGSEIGALARQVSYGWGCIPVEASIGEVRFTTSLFPKDGSYALPLKVAARRQMGPVDVGDRLDVEIRLIER